MLLPILLLGIASLIISWLLTALMIRTAPKLGLVDHPGGRKIHIDAKPLGGGIAICWSFLLPLLGVLLAARFYHADESLNAYIGGVKEKAPLALTILSMALLLHAVGLWDDRKPLGALGKFAAQVLAAAVLVIG